MKNKINGKKEFYKKSFKRGYNAGYSKTTKKDDLISAFAASFGYLDGSFDKRTEYKIAKKRTKNLERSL